MEERWANLVWVFREGSRRRVDAGRGEELGRRRGLVPLRIRYLCDLVPCNGGHI